MQYIFVNHSHHGQKIFDEAHTQTTRTVFVCIAIDSLKNCFFLSINAVSDEKFWR